MAEGTKIGDAYVQLGVDDAKYNEKMKNAKKGLGDLVAFFKGSKGLIAAAAGTAIGSFAISSVKAAEKVEESEFNLAAAIKLRGGEIKKLLPLYRDLSSKISSSTLFSATETKNAIAYGLSLGLTTDQIQKATKAAIGISDVLGIDLNTSMRLVAKAGQGMTETLSRYGIVLNENMTDAEKFNVILQKGNEFFSIAQARSETTAGGFDKLSKAWKSLKVSAGVLIEEYLHMDSVVRGIADALNTVFPKAKRSVEDYEDKLKGVSAANNDVTQSEEKKAEAMKKSLSIVSLSSLWAKMASEAYTLHAKAAQVVKKVETEKPTLNQKTTLLPAQKKVLNDPSLNIPTPQVGGQFFAGQTFQNAPPITASIPMPAGLSTNTPMTTPTFKIADESIRKQAEEIGKKIPYTWRP